MDASSGISVGPDGVARCWWSDSDDLYRRYHDLEWGRPVANDRELFEKLSLDGFQSGLSWLIILRKRENFRAAFRNFEPAAVASCLHAVTRGLNATINEGLAIEAEAFAKMVPTAALRNGLERFLSTRGRPSSSS